MKYLIACFLSIRISASMFGQTLNANSVVFTDPSLGSNGDHTAIYRSDINADFTRLRVQLGDEETAMFEMGYPYYSTGQWRNLFTVDGDGNGYFRGNVTLNGNLVVPGNGGNRQIYTWEGTDANWRIGMSVSPGFTKTLVTAHSQYITYHNAPGQGFAVGVNGGQSSFEIAGSNHSAFFRGRVGIGTPSPAASLQVAGGEIHLDADQALRGGGRWLISGNPSMVTVGTTNPDIHLKLDAGAPNRIFVNGTSGYVGIGTASPTEKLTVDGKVRAEELIIEVIGAPDYVFEKSYDLKSLDEVKKYIDENKHLPEVPSAKEMESNGVKVGEMEMILLKKIEEMTLYILELKKENEGIKKHFTDELNLIKSQMQKN